MLNKLIKYLEKQYKYISFGIDDSDEFFYKTGGACFRLYHVVGYKEIVLSKHLEEICTLNEIKAIIGHELAHAHQTNRTRNHSFEYCEINADLNSIFYFDHSYLDVISQLIKIQHLLSHRHDRTEEGAIFLYKRVDTLYRHLYKTKHLILNKAPHLIDKLGE